MIILCFINILIKKCINFVCRFLRYYFPTYENDNLLHMLDSNDQQENESNDTSSVIAEDLPPIDGQRLRDTLRIIETENVV